MPFLGGSLAIDHQVLSYWELGLCSRCCSFAACAGPTRAMGSACAWDAQQQQQLLIADIACLAGFSAKSHDS